MHRVLYRDKLHECEAFAFSILDSRIDFEKKINQLWVLYLLFIDSFKWVRMKIPFVWSLESPLGRRILSLLASEIQKDYLIDKTIS